MSEATYSLASDFLDIVQSSSVPWQQLAGKRVLISGANGMLASYLVETLLYLNDHVFAEKATVFALSRSQERSEARFANYLGRRDLVFCIQDVCDALSFDAPVDFIIHAASQASPKYYATDPVGTLDANVQGTRRLLDLAVRDKVESFLFVSSSEVYGATDNISTGITETDFGALDCMALRSCYAESKRLGETLCVAYQHQHGVPIRIVRPFHTYGPSLRLDDGRVFADFTKHIIENRSIVLNSDGTARRAFCYISDATIGFFLILLQGERGHAYNLGNPEQEISIFELATELVNSFPEKNLSVTRKEPEQDAQDMRSTVGRNLPSIAKLKALGWNPTVSIRDGFLRTIRARS